jgi:hypothetical protein
LLAPAVHGCLAQAEEIEAAQKLMNEEAAAHESAYNAVGTFLPNDAEDAAASVERARAYGRASEVWRNAVAVFSFSERSRAAAP